MNTKILTATHQESVNHSWHNEAVVLNGTDLANDMHLKIIQHCSIIGRLHLLTSYHLHTLLLPENYIICSRVLEICNRLRKGSDSIPFIFIRHYSSKTLVCYNII